VETRRINGPSDTNSGGRDERERISQKLAL
jgi:hypothetical protein